MALAHAGAPADVDDLRRQVHLPDRKGSLQLELVAATRRHGRIAYAFESQVQSLVGFLDSQLPVIVLQNLGARWLPIWHYAVVVGYEVKTDQFVMRSGSSERRLMGRAEFLRRWAASDYWGLVVIDPDAGLPAPVKAMEFLQSVSAHEALGQAELAEKGYRLAIARWPDNALAHLGMGNVYLHQGEASRAIDAYQTVLRLDPTSFPALNNLAYAYANGHEHARALETIERALAAVDEDDKMADDLRALKVSLSAR